MAEQIGGHHWGLEARLGQGGLEVLQDQLALGGCGVERDQVVVMEGDAVSAQFAELVDGFDGVQGGAGGDAEGIRPGPADGPKAEGEAVCRGGLESHESSLVQRWGGSCRPGRKQAGELVFNLNYMRHD
ncbi:hypothetical protein FQZ97_875520 [compost metagenome]